VLPQKSWQRLNLEALYVARRRCGGRADHLHLPATPADLMCDLEQPLQQVALLVQPL